MKRRRNWSEVKLIESYFKDAVNASCSQKILKVKYFLKFKLTLGIDFIIFLFPMIVKKFRSQRRQMTQHLHIF